MPFDRQSIALFATQGNSPAVMAVVVTVTGIVLVALGLVLLRIIRRSDQRAAKAVDVTLQMALQDLEAEKTRMGGRFDAGPDVEIEFCTYSGFFFWHTETMHRFVLPAQFALILLRRVHWHNTRRGLLAHGGLLIQVLSWISLLQQRRSVERQVRAMNRDDQ